MAEFNVSVRKLVAFSAKTGGFDRRFEPSPSGLEGIAGHHALQRKRGNDYLAEYPVSWQHDFDNIRLTVRGRCDGVVMLKKQVEEIKTTKVKPDNIPESVKALHWAQAKAYGYLVALENKWDEVNVTLTYLHLGEGYEKKETHTYQIAGLGEEFQAWCEHYVYWLKRLREWQIKRDHSIRECEWPFEEYRDGQRKMAVDIYRAIEAGENRLIEAPTGIGKSLASLFPAVKAIPEQKLDSIWYLTAKNSGHKSCEQALALMRPNGLRIKSLQLIAKEKACINDVVNCQSRSCPYAEGFFDKLAAARLALFDGDQWHAEDLEKVARDHQLCPYYLGQAMSDWADVIYGDYNYGFDPTARHTVYFSDNAEQYVMLVDEAHNLAGRVRDMLSTSLSRATFQKLKDHASPDLAKLINRVQNGMRKLGEKVNAAQPYLAQSNKPEHITRPLQQFVSGADDLLVELPDLLIKDNDLSQAYFDALRFNRMLELFDHHYVCEISTNEQKGRSKPVNVSLRCLDPTQHLATCYLTGKSHILFSATLRPLGFQASETAIATEYTKWLPSPFDPNNLSVNIVTDISTKYQHRQGSLEKLAELVKNVVTSKVGNYLVFMPSFKYAQQLEEVLDTSAFELITQTPRMSQDERDDFLWSFEQTPSEKSLVGLAVSGGIFGEGIDLVGEKLIGVIVVGPALPQFGDEQNTLKEYYDEKDMDGFAQAYQFPGLQRVMQAAGRVIRSETDKGVIVLVDPRFAEQRYREHYPTHWLTQIGRSEHAIDCVRMFFTSTV